MKNPKVGERVAWTMRGVIKCLDSGDAFVQLDGDTGERIIDVDLLRRLVPKKRERTYTETQISYALADIVGPMAINIRPKLLRALREWSGK